MGRFFVLFAALSLFLLSSPGDARALDFVSIGFDNVIGKIGYIFANPLRDEYASLGVHFRGEAEKDGGAILIAEAIGFSAESSPNVLAFNRTAKLANEGIATWPEIIFFDSLWKTVSIDVRSYLGMDHFILTGFDSSGKEVVSSNVDTNTTWAQISVSWPAGLNRVELTRLENGGNSFAADNLLLTERVVPEPGTMLLLGLGLTVMGILRRRI